MKTRGSLAKQSDCFYMAKTKRPERKMVLAAYNRKKILPRYPGNLKFRRNHSISHGLGDTSNFKFYHFYPGNLKFRRNHSISPGLGDTSNFKFYNFCQKLQNSKWPPFLEGGKIFEN